MWLSRPTQSVYRIAPRIPSLPFPPLRGGRGRPLPPLFRGSFVLGHYPGRRSGEELRQTSLDLAGLLVMDPVGRVEEDQAAVVAEVDARLGHLPPEETIAGAPEEQRRHLDARAGGARRRHAEGGAVPVDHGGDGAGLGPGLAGESEVGLGEGAGTAGDGEGTDAVGPIAPAQVDLGQPRQLEEEDVPAPTALGAVVEQVTPHDVRVRDVEQRQAVEAPREVDAHPPGDGASPVVAGEAGALAAGVVDQPDHVSGQPIEAVGGDAARLVAQVVAALVGDQDAVSRRGEGLDVAVPAIPELGKPVQQDEQPALRRTGLDGVKADAVGGDDAVPQLDRHAECPRLPPASLWARHQSPFSPCPHHPSPKGRQGAIWDTAGIRRFQDCAGSAPAADSIRMRSQDGSNSPRPPSKARPIPATPSSSPGSARQLSVTASSPIWKLRYPASPRPGWRKSRAASNQRRPTARSPGSPGSWYMRVEGCGRPAGAG